MGGKKDRRMYDRVIIKNVQATLLTDEVEIECTITDISETGIGILLSKELPRSSYKGVYSITLYDPRCSILENEEYIDVLKIKVMYKDGLKLGCKIFESCKKYEDYVMKKKVFEFIRANHDKQ